METPYFCVAIASSHLRRTGLQRSVIRSAPWSGSLQFANSLLIVHYLRQGDYVFIGVCLFVSKKDCTEIYSNDTKFVGIVEYMGHRRND